MRLIKLWAIAFLLLLLILPQPVWAALAQLDRTVLTLELLNARVKNPVLSGGIPTIDLQHFIIDLRPENTGFRANFEQILQGGLQRAGSSPLALDLSYSLIQGDFAGNNLGLKSPLYGQALAPIFTPTEQAQLQRDRRRYAQLSQLSMSLLGSKTATPAQISVFRGGLKLIQTRFSGEANFTNTFFLQPVDASGAIFTQNANWTETRFSRNVSFAGASFRKQGELAQLSITTAIALQLCLFCRRKYGG
jgi:hypothetical protein